MKYPADSSTAVMSDFKSLGILCPCDPILRSEIKLEFVGSKKNSKFCKDCLLFIRLLLDV
jgi:hypothetical protein